MKGKNRLPAAVLTALAAVALFGWNAGHIFAQDTHPAPAPQAVPSPPGTQPADAGNAGQPPGQGQAPGQAPDQMQNLIDAKYMGHRSYPGFTRLVFDTGGIPAYKYKVVYSDAEKKLTMYPDEGLLAFSFAPVNGVDSVVRDIDYYTNDEGDRGIAIKLGPAASQVRASWLSEPDRMVLDIYRKERPEVFLPAGRPVKTIAIDPGHGGRSAGISQGSLIEKNITFDIALRLKNALTRAGFKAVLTRTKDIDMSPAERAGAANLAKADLLVSIHASGSLGVGIYTMDEGDFDAEGAPDRAPLLWDDQNAPYLPDCLKLAKSVKESVGRIYEGADPQVHQARLAGISGAAMPAIEVEIGSLADQKQAEQLADDKFRGRLAVRLAKGIESFARGGEVEPTRKK